MPHTFEKVRQIALELAYDERAKLSQELWESLHPPAESLPQAEIDAAWDAEIKRRVEEIGSGTAEMISWEQVRAELNAVIVEHESREGLGD